MSVTVMKMNLRGVYFEVNVETLDRARYSRLARLSHGDEKVPLDSRGCYFYDRNPDLFNSILDYYSTGVLEISSKFSWGQVKDEVEFWEIEEKALSESSRVRYTEEREFEKKVHAVEVFEDRYAKLEENGSCIGLAEKTKGIWNFLEKPRTNKLTMAYAVLMYIIIPYLSVLNSFMHSRSDFSKFENHTNETVRHTHDQKRAGHMVILGVEIATKTAIFIELVLRFISWPNKRRFFCDTLNWFDLIGVILPGISMVISRRLIIHASSASFRLVMWSHLLLAACTFRVFRVFRLWRSYDTYRVLMLAVKYTLPHFLLCFCILRAFVELVGFSVYATQAHLPQTPFTDAFRGAWFASSLLSTMGFGDLVPANAAGRWLMSFAEGLAVLLLAMPVVAFVNNYKVASRVMAAARALHKKKELVVVESAKELA
ncbi:hypothetical protein CAPTEDRAFT_220437 [Capitella teleta]|uniref:BTB domain-containing protein n=1 Tax=Capitella teleta TaxID=283909 RepID=R7V5A0_CAPTE|nr:hypothetical protein CAPTEDRAFT_220437 [Capitella teleta]|eukprot:ELU13709.1 hypothetical protein CAPTEDRAFT_220437 [Capitella teleta]